MQWAKNLGMLVLSVWLVLAGAIHLFGFGWSYGHLNYLMDVLGIVAGAAMLWTLRGTSLGMLFVSIWLILVGVRDLLGITRSYEYLNWLVDILGVAAGVLLLWTLKTRKLGALFLSAWLILAGLKDLFGVGEYRHVRWLLAILLLAAGVSYLWALLRGKEAAA